MKPQRALTMVCFPPVLLVLALVVIRAPHNPPADPAHAIEASLNVPPRIHDLLKKACYDCHSSQTRWPWYATLPPVSYLIEHDVARGRAAMNFSEWGTGAGRTPGLGAGTLMSACAAVEQHWMPKAPYPYLHPESRWTADDARSFCAWTREEAQQARAQRSSNATDRR